MGIYAPSFTDDEVCEESGQISENFSPDGITCSVVLACAWSIRHDVVTDIVGGKEYWPHGSFVKRPFAVSAAIVPRPAKGTTTGQSIDYPQALITVNYERKKLDPEQLASESLEPTAEFITQDHKRYVWGSSTGNPLTEAEAPGRIVRGLNLVRTIYKLPSVPVSLLSLPGTCNDTSYVSSLLGLTFPAETLLFSPPTLDRTIETDGSEGFNLSLKFSYKPEGWNKFWRAESESYEEIYDTQSEAVYKNYPLADFSDWLA